MSIRSFLVHVAPAQRDRVAAAIGSLPGCEALPAENRDLVVVVAEAEGREAEAAFDLRLATWPGVTAVALVAGFGDDRQATGSTEAGDVP